MKARILIVDDDASMRENFGAVLHDEYDVELASTVQEAHDHLAGGEIDVVLLDLHLHGRVQDRSGFAILQSIRREYVWPIGVIMFTVENDIAIAVEAMRLGADHYLVKTCSDAELKLWVQRVYEHATLKRDRMVAEQQREGEFDAIIGKSPELMQVLADVEKLADRDSPVLIIGESGTGKELIARRLHDRSWRKKQNKLFVAINCAAVPEELAESEFFGHYPGAFTGATKPRVGKFEFVGEGTILLDEIDSMPLALQGKLLRALEDRAFTPLGSNREVRLRARFVAAAKSDLHQAVAEKKFREDLFYRLNGVSLKLPPLRERAEDVPCLVKHFLTKLNRQRGRVIENVTDEAMDNLVRYHWPGNIRELYRQIERIFDLAESGTRVIAAAMLSEDIRQAAGARPGFSSAKSGECQKMPEVVDAIRKQMIAAAMQQANNNVTHAAKILGISRRGLQKMLPRYYHPK